MAARQYGRMRDDRRGRTHWDPRDTSIPQSEQMTNYSDRLTPYSEEVLAGKLGNPELDAGELSLPDPRGSPILRQYPVGGYPEARVGRDGLKLIPARARAVNKINTCPTYGQLPGSCDPRIYPRITTPESRFITQPYISPKSQGRGRPTYVQPSELTWSYEPLPVSSPARQNGIRLSNAVIVPKYHQMQDYNMPLHEQYLIDAAEINRIKGYRAY